MAFKTATMLTDKRYRGRVGGGRIDLIGIHTMEAAEGPNTAENVARYFRTANASSHWCVDNNSRVRVVNDGDTAWTLPGANSRSLNIEMAGYAGQTASQWDDKYSNDMLEIAAVCCAEWCKKYDIPVRLLTDAQVRSGYKGFVPHSQISRVYKKSSHWDPGPNFPWAKFLGLVNSHLSGTTSPPVIETVKYNADGSIQLAVDGIRGMHHISRWQEVMGTPIDGRISRHSQLIMADQNFLNSVIAPEHMRNLTGYTKLAVDGDEGRRTILARQWWMRHAMAEQHQKNLIGGLLAFDGKLGPNTNKVHQFALNNTSSGSKVYGQVM